MCVCVSVWEFAQLARQENGPAPQEDGLVARVRLVVFLELLCVFMSVAHPASCCGWDGLVLYVRLF